MERFASVLTKGAQTTFEEQRERAILVGVDRPNQKWSLDSSLAELERLADTAGADTVAKTTQKLESPNPRTFVGTGKAEEIAKLARSYAADLVIFDDELTPSQQSNLEKTVDKSVKIIDRTALILDIFGLHAKTHEGKLQVQMAQLQYLYPRLRGMWAHLAKDRTRGGIGSRFGQGESQLEVDRRLIRDRISVLRRELANIASNRDVQRKERTSSDVFRVALAGYTNAGKSTLLNRLTDAGVYVQDQLFATLDPTTRVFVLPGGKTTTITDTVGFVRKLPHTLVELIESFKSTLAEVADAHLILHVVDGNDPHLVEQLAAVEEVLKQIKADGIDRLLVFNKCDLLEPERAAELRESYPEAIFVSAVTGEGIEDLVANLAKQAALRDEHLKVLIPYGQGSLLSDCHKYGHILHEEYVPEGTLLEAVLPASVANRARAFAVDEAVE